MPELRTASADELPAMLTMEARYTDNDASLESFRETFEAHPELFVVCVDHDDIVAEASGRAGDDAVVLESIAVANDRQGEGIGRRVLEYFEEQAPADADRVSVASADNVEGFYRNLGYEPTKILLQLNVEDGSGERDGDRAATADEDDWETDDRRVDDWRNDDRIIDWKPVGEGVLFLYAEFEEYDPAIRRELKTEFGAFEANTIYEKRLSE